MHLGAVSARGIGWAKPTPVNPNMLRYGSAGQAIVAFAGPASNLIIAAIVAIPLRYVLHSTAATTTCPLVVLNAMYTFVGDQHRPVRVQPDPGPATRRVADPPRGPRPEHALHGRSGTMQYGPLILLVLIFTGAFGIILGPIIDAVLRVLVGL